MVERRPSDTGSPRDARRARPTSGLRYLEEVAPTTSTACGGTIIDRLDRADSRGDGAASSAPSQPDAIRVADDLVAAAVMTDAPRAASRCHVANIGVKDDTDDLVVIAADRPVPAAGVFTRSRFAGPSVTISREHVADGARPGDRRVSKNANVATGDAAHADAHELVAARRRPARLRSRRRAGRVDRRDRAALPDGAHPRRHSPRMPMPAAADRSPTAAARRDHDHRHRRQDRRSPRSARAAPRVVGMAKGVGMIEPDMATMIAVLLTDAAVDADELDAMFRRVIDRTFNCVSDRHRHVDQRHRRRSCASGAAGAGRPRRRSRPRSARSPCR